MFNEFLDETTPVPTMINVDDVKTVDLAGFDKQEDDFPIYDTEIVVTNIMYSLNWFSYILSPFFIPFLLKYSVVTYSPHSPT